jgi:hypothetical protein
MPQTEIDISDGAAAHKRWESTLAADDRNTNTGNECEVERDIADAAEKQGADMALWWRGRLKRSDEWRNDINPRPNFRPMLNEVSDAHGLDCKRPD